MEKQFIEGELNTHEDDHINSLILSQAADIAEELTELECKLHNIVCWIYDDEGQSFSEEAQDIFNEYYDKYTTELYDLLNAQLKVIE